jgi:hypothetical protein
VRQLFTVVDDFYDDFAAVRAAALAAQYEPRRRGKYPGRNSVAPHCLAEAMPKLAALAGAPVQGRANSGSGSFRFTLATDEPDLDIHFDNAQLSGVVFLNTAEQCRGRIGTSFWRHQRTGLTLAPPDAAGRQRVLDEILTPDSFVRDRWELELQVAMAPNRLILFPSSLFHSPHDRFGDTLETARLIQVFFLERRQT